jgi:hypothetical protein
MTPIEAFAKFITSVCVPEKRGRYVALANSQKGQAKILNYLCHEFESTIRKDCVKQPSYESIQDNPCLIFERSKGFGVQRNSFREAHDELSSIDSWLIVLEDGSAGSYRPEGKFDSEILIAS